MEQIVLYTLSIVANIIANYICKWLDNKSQFLISKIQNKCFDMPLSFWGIFSH